MGVAGLERTVVGRYRLWDCLGHGSHTAVYRASTSAGEQSALKVVDVRVQGGEDLAERLRRDAVVLDRIDHPSILPIRDTIATRDMTAVAMPFELAPTLQELMQQGRLDSDLAWSILSQVEDSLTTAHRSGLACRLLKPANILVRDGRAYLAEFGITGRSTGQMALTTPGFRMPDPQYLAPEQVLGEEADHRADVYAFAVLVFELATGTTLYDDAKPSRVLRRTLNEPPPSAYARNPHIPREVDRVLRRALARDPERRHPSVAALIAELVDPNGGVDVRHGSPRRSAGVGSDVSRVSPRSRPPGSETAQASGGHVLDSLIDVLTDVLAREQRGDDSG